MLTLDKIQAVAKSQIPILTAYLNTQNRNASRHPRVPSHLVWFRKETTALSRTLLPRDAERFQQAVDRVEQFLEGRHAKEKALALFAGSDTWTVFPVQAAVESEIRWGKPAIGQLFRLVSEHHSYGIIVIDHHVARFFQFHLGELNELGENRFEIDESHWKRKDVGHIPSDRIRKGHGADQDLFDHRLEAQYERIFRETTDHATALSKKHDFAALFLVGPERLVVPIRTKFHPALRARLVSVYEDFGKFSRRGILRRLEPLMADYERKRQIVEVEKLLAADSGFVTDVDETLAQLQNGTLRTIIVAANRDFHLHECTKCGAVNRSSDPVCAACGGPRRTIALLDVLPRIAAEHGTKVEFVSGEAALILARVGGAAGWLRQSKRVATGCVPNFAVLTS
jgi:hypothetical protein